MVLKPIDHDAPKFGILSYFQIKTIITSFYIALNLDGLSQTIFVLFSKFLFLQVLKHKTQNVAPIRVYRVKASWIMLS